MFEVRFLSEVTVSKNKIIDFKTAWISNLGTSRLSHLPLLRAPTLITRIDLSSQDQAVMSVISFNHVQLRLVNPCRFQFAFTQFHSSGKMNVFHVKVDTFSTLLFFPQTTFADSTKCHILKLARSRKTSQKIFDVQICRLCVSLVYCYIKPIFM